jgi:hypothetical protein
MSTTRKYRYILAIAAFLGCGIQVLSAGNINFSVPSSRINFVTSSSKIRLNSSLEGVDGTITCSTTLQDHFTDHTLVCDRASIEEEGLSYILTGTYQSAGTHEILLAGNHELLLDAGQLSPTITVSSSGNSIIGEALAGGPIVFHDADSQATISMMRPLEKSIHLYGGSLTLGSALELGTTVSVGDLGTINCAGHLIGLPAQESTWSGTLDINNAQNIVLNANVNLSGMWTFGPGNSTSVIDGRGHILDLTQGGTIALYGGQSLLFKNIALTGVGGTEGNFIFYDNNATLSLDNVTLALSSSYTFSAGNIYFYNQPSTINTDEYFLTVTYDGHMTIDGISVVADSLDKSVIRNVIPLVDDGGNLSLDNDGRLLSPAQIHHTTHITADYGTFGLPPTLDLFYTQQLIARGDHSSTITFDGNGGRVRFAQDTRRMIYVYPGITVTMQNVVLDGLRPEHIEVGSGGAFYFGDNVTIQMQDDLDLTHAWTFKGASRIDGGGRTLTFGALGGLTLQNTQMYLKDLVLDDVQSTTNLLPLDNQSTFSLSNVDLRLSSTFTHERGYLDFLDRVSIAGNGKSIVLNAAQPVTIHDNSDLILDRGLTLTYQSESAQTNKFVFNSSSSRCHLNNATLNSTFTGLALATGQLLVNGRSRLVSNGRNNAEGMVLHDSLDLHILPGSRLSLSGLVVHRT